MLESTLTAEQKRVVLRSRLRESEILVLPGAFNPLSSMLIEKKGFQGVYLSGAVLAAELGLPDVGLTTLTEVAARAQQVARSCGLPLIVDADTGFGGAMNVARTVQLLEDAGVAAIHLEDQENPKRCGHLDGKRVVDADTAVQRIRSAVMARRDRNLMIIARTDTRSIDGLPAAIDRMKVLVDAGADAVFPEALVDLGEFESVREAIDVPILANMTEFGKSDLVRNDQLEAVGVDMVIYPVSLLRLAMGAAVRALDTLLEEGSLGSLIGEMQHRQELYDLLDYGSYAEYDTSVFNFRL